jgi:paraquat-inducible protein B
MSTKSNPALLGLFIVGALALAAAGLLILGGGHLFEPSRSFVLYFDGDLNGLDVGAPVTSRGVRIGEVTSISLVFNPETETIATPVVIRVYGRVFEEPEASARRLSDIPMQRMIENGLRARLELQSVLTGKLRVNLAFHPETPIRLRGTETGLAEIPTMPTALESLTQQFSELPLDQIITDIHISMRQIAGFLEEGKLERTVEEMNTTLAGLSAMMEAGDVHDALSEIRDSARTLRVFLDFLNRHPDALLRGKQGGR